jgi:leucyl-tRNA synthetase
LHPEQAGRPDLSWPVADAALTVVDTVTIAVQVGGKLRGTISVPAEADKEAVLAAAALEENVARLLAGKRVVKQIYVPGRIVNFVVVDAA